MRVIVALLLLLGLGAKLGAQPFSEGSRILAAKGIAVIKDRTFYSDSLARCVRFDVIEDRTASGDPDRGYYVFSRRGKSSQVTPQGLLHVFLFGRLSPGELTPAMDLEDYEDLSKELQMASSLNEDVSKQLASYARRVDEIVAKLSCGLVLREGRWCMAP